MDHFKASQSSFCVLNEKFWVNSVRFICFFVFVFLSYRGCLLSCLSFCLMQVEWALSHGALDVHTLGEAILSGCIFVSFFEIFGAWPSFLMNDHVFLFGFFEVCVADCLCPSFLTHFIQTVHRFTSNFQVSSRKQMTYTFLCRRYPIPIYITFEIILV